MKLTTKDRIILQSILPQQASIQEIGTVIETNALLTLSDEEKKAVNFRNDGGRVEWDKDEESEINLKHDHVTVLKKAIKKLDDAEQVQAVQYETFLKINKL